MPHSRDREETHDPAPGLGEDELLRVRPPPHERVRRVEVGGERPLPEPEGPVADRGVVTDPARGVADMVHI